MSAAKHVEPRAAPPLWRALDLILDAYAAMQGHDGEAAGFAMLAAYVLGERLGLSDTIIRSMAQSAASAERRTHRRSARRTRGPAA